jgi:hypothetical protein
VPAQRPFPDASSAGHVIEGGVHSVPVTITNDGRPVAVLVPALQRPRRFGQLPALAVPDNFDDPLPDAEIAAWEGNS